MATAVVMPKLGMTMTEGRVLEWCIGVGEPVDKGEILLEIESEKAAVELEATATGVLRHVYVDHDDMVPCGTLLGAITDGPDEDFDVEVFRVANDKPEAVAAPVVPAAPPRAARPAEQAEKPPRSSPPVTPAARALAKKLGVDVARMGGSGPAGRVTKEDVEAWAERRKALVAVAEGVSLEVPSHGEGDAIVLLPGFGTDVAVFARQAPALAERYRVLGVNPRGVGLSDAPEAECYEVEVSAADAAAVVDGPVHVIGASLGAAVAIELALAAPAKVRSLTLITPLVEATPRLLAVIDGWCRLAREALPDTVARALLPWFFSSDFLAEDAARDRTARGLAEIAARVPAATLERTAEGLRRWSATRLDDLSKIGAPTLVVAAGADLLTPGAREIAEAIPGALYVEVAGAGHAVGLEEPEQTNKAILAHLEAAG